MGNKHKNPSLQQEPEREQQAKPEINKADKNEVMSTSDVQVERLRLLLFGYLRENLGVDDIGPVELVNECAIWLKQPLRVQFLRYYHTFQGLPLQIWMEGDDLNIIQPSDIKHYQIKYFKADHSSKPTDTEYINQNESNCEVVCSSFIYPFNCLSYTTKEDINPGGRAFLKVSAIDIKNRIIASSEWKAMYPNVNSVTYLRADDDAYENICKFWNEEIAIKSDSECVNVDQWTEAMMGENVQFADTKETAVKMFYFILFKAGKGEKGDNDEEKLLMSVQDFDGVVSDGTFDEYYHQFAKFIRLCWKNIKIGSFYY